MKKQNFDFKDKTILIVDDIEDCYSLLDLILKRVEVNTIWAKNGLEAIKVCKDNDQIDLALMDIRMPKMNGYDACIKIKELRPDLPIIIQSSYEVDYEKHKVKDAGFEEYISKPINREKLLRLLQTYL